MLHVYRMEEINQGQRKLIHGFMIQIKNTKATMDDTNIQCHGIKVRVHILGAIRVCALKKLFWTGDSSTVSMCWTRWSGIFASSSRSNIFVGGRITIILFC